MVLIAVVTVFLIRTFLMQPFLVSGASMEPNFSTGNYLIVDEISYRLGSLERNDVVVFEYPYVDKHYRDSYYFYFSTKHNEIKRDSIRLSFFSDDIEEAFFYNESKHINLQNSFLGFITLRPTRINILGRNLVSPRLFKEKEFVLMLSSFSVMIQGAKLQIDAFPHCSQDNETLTCAEITVLNIMEYFGNKYSEYTPILPSKIIKMLSARAYERQLPSTGLTVDDLSFALKQLGFSPKTYSKNVEGDDILKKILDIYIESGIPVIGVLEKENDDEGHAIIIDRKSVV